MPDAGCLYLCATPIGNLEDVTLRALRVLGQVDLVAAEDTRHTRKLLHHFELTTPLTSLHEHNESEKAPRLVARLLGGEDIALVSDAGTPAISDPGRRLVQAARKAGIPVVSVPGPSAAVAALAVSGLEADRYVFEGFPPRRRQERRRHLAGLSTETRTLVFFEAPHRLAAFLADLAAELGERPAVVARELTKVHEEVREGPLPQLAAHFEETRPRGEFVVLVAGAAQPPAPQKPPAPGELAHAVAARMAAGMSKRDAITGVARERGLPRREVYRAAVGIPGRAASPAQDEPTS